MTNLEPVLPSFPVDEQTLNLVEHALGASLTTDENGEWKVVGAEFQLSKLLDFLSGYDPSKEVEIDTDVFMYEGGPLYHSDDIIRALIAEVRRLRGEAL